jgi:predicted GIY-YIG superfamily endonuclease
VQDAGLHEGSYFTCVTASRNRTLYAGVTGNLQKRVFKHKDRYDCEPVDHRRALDRMDA